MEMELRSKQTLSNTCLKTTRPMKDLIQRAAGSSESVGQHASMFAAALSRRRLHTIYVSREI